MRVEGLGLGGKGRLADLEEKEDGKKPGKYFWRKEKTMTWPTGVMGASMMMVNGTITKMSWAVRRRVCTCTLVGQESSREQKKQGNGQCSEPEWWPWACIALQTSIFCSRGSQCHRKKEMWDLQA